MPEQTLPEFLYSVITEQRKSISSLVDALNEAKDGISQLTASAERSEESRRQLDAAIRVNETLSSAYARIRTLVRADKLPYDVEDTPDNIYALTEQRVQELLNFRAKTLDSENVAWMDAAGTVVYINKCREDDIPLIVAPVLAAGTLDCVIPAARTSSAVNTEAAEADTAPVDRLATICTYQPGNTNVLPGANRS